MHGACEFILNFILCLFFFLMLRRPPSSPLFPSTTLFRSDWVDFLAQDPASRSCTSICLAIVDPWFAALAREAQAAAGLIGVVDLLAVNEIEAGQLELEQIAFSLRSRVESTTETLAMEAQQNGLELITHIDPNVPDSLIGDPTRLHQVILNLVGNAIKFTEQGEIVVGVQQNERTDQDVELQFSVQDTGVGIPADKLEAIFKPFAQADVSTTRKYGGTGLGLTIAKRLVEMMGGEIGVDSRKGVGREVWFTALFSKRAELPGHREANYSELKDVRVLIVDDSETARETMKNLLETVGMLTLSVVDGSHALEQLCTCAVVDEAYEIGRASCRERV